MPAYPLSWPGRAGVAHPTMSCSEPNRLSDSTSIFAIFKLFETFIDYQFIIWYSITLIIYY